MNFNYVVNSIVFDRIDTFYSNVSLKYFNTYSLDLMERNVTDAYDSINLIENGLLRRKPTISRWNGLYMANTKTWYFAYRIDGDTIYVEDACHSQNMHEMFDRSKSPLVECQEWMAKLGCYNQFQIENLKEKGVLL